MNIAGKVSARSSVTNIHNMVLAFAHQGQQVECHLLAQAFRILVEKLPLLLATQAELLLTLTTFAVDGLHSISWANKSNVHTDCYLANSCTTRIDNNQCCPTTVTGCYKYGCNQLTDIASCDLLPAPFTLELVQGVTGVAAGCYKCGCNLLVDSRDLLPTPLQRPCSALV